jgi:hypothetical protein
MSGTWVPSKMFNLLIQQLSQVIQFARAVMKRFKENFKDYTLLVVRSAVDTILTVASMTLTMALGHKQCPDSSQGQSAIRGNLVLPTIR